VSLDWNVTRDRLNRRMRETSGGCEVTVTLRGSGKTLTGRVTRDEPPTSWVFGEVIICSTTRGAETVEVIDHDEIAAIKVVTR